MKMLLLCRRLAIVAAGLACVVLLAAPPVVAQETGDSQIFLAGFNAYQQKEYATAVTRLGEVLQKHPDTPLRDMTLFWLARAHYKAGNRQDAARYMAQFVREYPENPLKNTVEEELLTLAAQFEKSGQAAAIAKAEEERKAREEAEKQRLAQLKADEERKVREEAERQQQARAKQEQERIAREKAEAERVAKAKAEAERIAAQKAVAARLAQEQAEREAAEKAEKARILKAKAEEERKAREEAEKQRLAQLKAQEDQRRAAEAAAQAARQKAEVERVAAEKKAAEERLAREKAEAERVAKAKAEAERIAAQKAAEERKAAELIAARKAEEERKAREEAEKQRLAQLKAQEDQKRAAEAERIAAQKKAAEERLAREKAEAERVAKAKAEAERVAAEKKAAELRAQEQQATAQKAAAAKAREEQLALREKAIAEYKGILERFPGTPAAKSAAVRLQELGVAVTVPTATAAAASAPAALNAQVLTLEVAQYAAFEFAAKGPAAPVAVAQAATVPFEIVNRGNGPDSFYLAAGFPAECAARFASASAPEQSINQTPLLQPGERFSGLLQLQLPAGTIDGLRITHPIKAASSFTREVSQSREISLVASAPLLRAVIKADATQPAPGERVQYRVTLLNVGSMAASDVTLRLNYPAQYEPVEGGVAGFRKEMQAALVQDGLQLKSGESREFVATFQVKDEALAREELVVRADLINNQLQARSSFHGAPVSVLPISAVAVKLASARVVAIPGQTVTIPVTVVNNGNQRERFSLVAGMPSSQKVSIYQDLNRDGLRQHNEPEVTVIGPLGPREEAALLLEVVTQPNAPDGAEAGISFSAAPESSQGKVALAEARLGFSRPVLQLALKGRSGLLVPGELLTIELVVHNQGSNLAKGVELQASWPEQLELMTAVPAAEGKGAAHGTGWRLGELGAGEKRVVKASFRVRPGTGVGTGIQLKSVLNYLDQLGNRY